MTAVPAIPAPTRRGPSFFTSAFLWTLTIGFCALMIVTLIPSVSHNIAAALHCAGAEGWETETSSGGSVTSRSAGGAISGNRSTATSTTEMTCFMPGTEVRRVGNDTIFLTGIGAGFVFSVVGGIVVAAIRRIIGRLKR
ncbi:MAG: hypothetical protein KME04_18085 [Pleurocapsa minor GSE-CHR-MK-17-07R]|jgi:hypothetical protein|nr:hypothetical protein [Pleurocapsa minor GSE-CHR-MK 17-07R]